MVPTKTIGKLKTKDFLDTDLYRVEVELPEPVSFSAGQYMSINVGGSIHRCYSISNPSGHTNILETFVDVSPHGPAYKYFSQVNVGDSIELIVPLGQFTYKNSKRPAYFFATGSGLVPFLSMFLEALEKNEGKALHLFWGVKNEKRLFAIERLEALLNQSANFNYQIYVSNSDTDTNYRVGRITQIFDDKIENDIDAYICGGKEMVEEVREKLAMQGVSYNQIYHERFY